MTVTEAYRAGSEPLREFMLKHTRDEELALMTRPPTCPTRRTGSRSNSAR